MSRSAATAMACGGPISNLMIVMGLGGLWHGAGLELSGMWGCCTACCWCSNDPCWAGWRRSTLPALRLARMSLVFVCVTMLWIFFKLPNFDHAVGYLTGMFSADARIRTQPSCSTAWRCSIRCR